MDYVSSHNMIIVRERRLDQASTILAYDMVYAAMKNKEKFGREKERHA